jgi:hypothetical protein
MQNKVKIFKGLCRLVDEKRLAEYLIPQGIEESIIPRKVNSYFKKYGFNISNAYSYLYPLYNRLHSEKYISPSLYYYYINPTLCNLNFTHAYIDKSHYGKLFPNVNQPYCVFKNINGRFYNNEDLEISAQDAIRLIGSEKEDLIIKPSINSGGGNGVSIFHPSDFSVLQNFRKNYIVQRRVMQHENMCRLNDFSLNTCRIVTLRVPHSGKYVILGSAVRFGSGKDFRDNACAGGGFSKINENGIVDRRIYKFRQNNVPDRDFDLKIPCFEDVMHLCLSLASQTPYMDLIGWDIALDQDGKPTLIELNVIPDSEFTQISNGPMFGEYTDEVMDMAKEVSTIDTPSVKQSFSLDDAHDRLFNLMQPNYFSQ